jgi:3-dehydroquinate synthase
MGEPIRLEIRAGLSCYPVLVGRGTLEHLPAALDGLGLLGRLRIVADQRVADLHASGLLSRLRDAGRQAALLEISGRERDKNLTTLERVYDWLIDVGTDRSDVVVAFGGGVVGDLAGFAAATYLRGVRLVHLPTTLLAMVDSSIGGKTGVDHPAAKNLIGAFHQPSLVLADLDLLRTLPRRELAGGWAEVIKMGVVASPELFSRLEAAADETLSLRRDTAWAIASSIELKGQIVALDERETRQGGRMVLNYGHTIGHAIEAATGYGRLLHGEAVAIGMAGAARIARRLGYLDTETEARQAALMSRFGLPSRCPGLSAEQLWAPLRRDKKAVGTRLRWVLPTAIGSVQVVESVPDSFVHETLEWLVAPSAEAESLDADTAG